MENKNLIEDVFELIKYIGENELPQEEVNAMLFLLRSMRAGDSQRITTEKERSTIMAHRKVRNFFQKNPNKYIVIVGDVKIPENQIFGLSSYFGIKSKNLKLFLDYSKLKKSFPFSEISNQNCIAVIIGAVPHNVTSMGNNSSPIKTALESTNENVQSFVLTDNKVTKEKLRACFEEFSLNLRERRVLQTEN
ncbi:MAG: hypothetical protein KBC11_03010 [Candidatus Pacebacteria bacterium]|nr:hypothetical protein [Candidatus Paceibacterota bacterium]